MVTHLQSADQYPQTLWLFGSHFCHDDSCIPTEQPTDKGLKYMYTCCPAILDPTAAGSKAQNDRPAPILRTTLNKSYLNKLRRKMYVIIMMTGKYTSNDGEADTL